MKDKKNTLSVNFQSSHNSILFSNSVWRLWNFGWKWRSVSQGEKRWVFSFHLFFIVWWSRIVYVCVVGDKACPFNRRTIIGRTLVEIPFMSVWILLGRPFLECGNDVWGFGNTSVIDFIAISFYCKKIRSLSQIINIDSSIVVISLPGKFEC